MKNLFMLVSLIAVSFGFSSCCTMFGAHSNTAGYRTESHQVKTCGSNVKTVTTKVRVACGAGVHFYSPKKDCGGSTSQETLNMVTTQGSSGSPSIGLVPSMKKLAP